MENCSAFWRWWWGTTWRRSSCIAWSTGELNLDICLSVETAIIRTLVYADKDLDGRISFEKFKSIIGLGDNCQILAVRSDNCKIRQLSVGTTVRSDNCKIRQLSVGTAVSGPTVSGNCKCFPGTETTVRSYSFRADNCKILQFWRGQLSDLTWRNESHPWAWHKLKCISPQLFCP